MITREMIIEKLSSKYPEYKFIPMEVTKNGDVHLNAISARKTSDAISPTIYTDSIINKCDDNIDKAVELISNILEQNQTPDIDVASLTDKNYILNQIRIGVQKASDENLVKRTVDDFPGMEAYLYFGDFEDSNSKWSVKIRPDLLSKADINVDDAWGQAEKHTFEATTLQSMASVLSEMVGNSFDNTFEEQLPFEMTIISNREKCRGAASILNHELLKKYAIEHNCSSICVIPSSIHECILLPLDETYSIDEFDAMVCEVNATQVAPEDVLVNRAYVINFNEQRNSLCSN